jgi:hypothetical protein
MLSSTSHPLEAFQFKPYEVKAFRSDAKHRQKRKTPAGVYTCWEINTSGGTAWNDTVPCCAPCGRFKAEKGLYCRLIKLQSNRDSVRAYQCDTFWQASSERNSNAVTTSTPESYEPIVESERPRKERRTLEPPVSPLRFQVTPSPVKNTRRSRQAIKKRKSKLPADSDGEELQSLCDDLQVRLKLSSDELAKTEKEKKQSVHNCTLLQHHCDEEKRKATDQFFLHEQLVSELKQRLLDVAASAEGLRKADASYIETLEAGHLPIPQNVEEMSHCLESIVDRAAKKGTHLESRVKTLCETVWSNQVFNGECATYLLDKATGIIQRENPYRRAIEIAKVIDLSGSVLNLSGYDTLRLGMEADENGRVKRMGGYLTSKYQVRKAMSLIEEHAKGVIPYEVVDVDGIDGFKFEYEPLLLYILKLFKLKDAARDINQPPVQISITLDGADLSRNVTHVTAGVKINDPRSIDPVSGLPIGVQDSRKTQSRELCFPFKSLLAKDSKELYNNHFGDFFAFFKDVQANGLDGGAISIDVSSPQDQSSFWKALKRGGACKVAKDFCHCCACTSDGVITPNKVKCARCIETGRENCYHWEVGDEACMLRVQAELAVLKDTYPYLADESVLEKLKIRLDECQVNKLTDLTNIAYAPRNRAEKQLFGEVFLNHDLQVLGLSIVGSLETRRERLKSVLKHFYRTDVMGRTIEASKYPGAFITIRQAIPCILHMENRCGEKMIKLLLLEGYNRQDITAAEQERLIVDFEELINSSVLGTQRRKAHWRLNTGKDRDNRKVIGDQSMPNTHVRRFLDHFEDLAELCLIDEERLAKWNEAISLWINLMEFARKRSDFTEEEIVEFQDLADDFFERWVDLNHLDGLGNYFHLIGAGHLAFYLREWRNLFRYSQQGWESMNALIKSFFYRRTQRGGHGGKKDTFNSKMTPIARWLQRKLYFLSGDYKNCN